MATRSMTDAQLEKLALRAATIAVEQATQRSEEVAEKVATKVSEECCARLESSLAKMEVASKPQEKAEEEDTEGVDLMLSVRMCSRGFPRT